MMPLETHIKQLIAQTGPISMAEFIQIALSHPQYGYYKSREPFGVRGDFTTSPEISQMFGELIGAWSADIWQKMGSPANMEIVEIGPGRGTLMGDFLRATAMVTGFHDSISIAMVETSNRLTGVQHSNIQHLHPRIKWYNAINELPQRPLIIVANELFDALPVHQYVKQNGAWFEKMLGLGTENELMFALEKRPAPSHSNEAHEGAVMEICPAATALIVEMSRRIKQYQGAALIIDYGYIYPQYKDTITAIGHHKHCNLLDDIGMVDISSHVDFGRLAHHAKANGMKIHGPVFQGDFLKKLGIDFRTENLCKNASATQKKDIQTARERLTGNNNGQMGELFKVLAITCENIMPEGF